MRKTLTKGVFIKVVGSDFYPDSDDIAKELGSTEKLNKKIPRTGSTGDVIGSKDGYVLIDFGDFEYLVDSESVEVTPRPSEIKLILRYMKLNTVEEFTSQEDMEKRLSTLISQGHLKMDEELKVYEIAKSKVLKIKLDIFLE